MTKANCRTELTRRIARLLARANAPDPIRLTNRLFLRPAVLKRLFKTRDATEHAPNRRAKTKTITPDTQNPRGKDALPLGSIKESNSCLK